MRSAVGILCLQAGEDVNYRVSPAAPSTAAITDLYTGGLLTPRGP
jgi:hypothetical protein